MNYHITMVVYGGACAFYLTTETRKYQVRKYQNVAGLLLILRFFSFSGRMSSIYPYRTAGFSDDVKQMCSIFSALIRFNQKYMTGSTLRKRRA